MSCFDLIGLVGLNGQADGVGKRMGSGRYMLFPATDNAPEEFPRLLKIAVTKFVGKHKLAKGEAPVP